jgi:hypothetical protein
MPATEPPIEPASMRERIAIARGTRDAIRAHMRRVSIWALMLTACTGRWGDIEPPRRADEIPLGQLASARVRRLTGNEYAKTIAHAVGATETVDFPAEAFANGYDNRADQLIVNGILADRLFREVPEIARARAADLIAEHACGSDEICAQTILSSVAARAYRRPPTEEEIADLMGVFRVGIEGESFASGVALALSVILQSPGILYHTEIGAPGAEGEAIALTPHEVAEQIAYTLTGGPPDAALAIDADSGRILEAEVRAEHARRLLSNAVSDERLGEFAVRWLNVATLMEIGRSPERYPDWPAMRASALDETRQTFALALRDDDLDLGALLTSQTSRGDETMATFYGAVRSADGRLALPAGERFGILTHASVLARHSLSGDSAPVHRGKLVRTRLFCQELPDPPPNLVIMPPPDDPSLTSRQRWEATTRDNPTCWSCHQRTDPIGYGFENYDAIGRFRAMDRGQPVDASSALTDTDVDGPFGGPGELAAGLASSASVRECFARHWLEFSMGRQVDERTVRSIAAEFIAGGPTLRDLMIAIVRSEAFATRSRARSE